jgi:hypothetical protein
MLPVTVIATSTPRQARTQRPHSQRLRAEGPSANVRECQSNLDPILISIAPLQWRNHTPVPWLAPEWCRRRGAFTVSLRA